MKLFKSLKKLGLGASVFATTAVSAFATVTPITQVDSIADVKTNISGVYTNGAQILYLGAAIVGLLFIAAGLMKFKAHAHDMQGTSGAARHGAMFLVVGACLIAIPLIMMVGHNSFFGSETGLGLVSESSALSSNT